MKASFLYFFFKFWETTIVAFPYFYVHDSPPTLLKEQILAKK
jgi:hypothetical protein